MNIQYPTRNIQSRRKEIKPEAVDFRVSDLSGVALAKPDATVWRIRFPAEPDSKKQGKPAAERDRA